MPKDAFGSEGVAFKIEAVGGVPLSCCSNRVSGVDLTLNKWEEGARGIRELARGYPGRCGDIEYDPRTEPATSTTAT